jgi:hypothetical protein
MFLSIFEANLPHICVKFEASAVPGDFARFLRRRAASIRRGNRRFTMTVEWRRFAAVSAAKGREYAAPARRFSVRLSGLCHHRSSK